MEGINERGFFQARCRALIGRKKRQDLARLETHDRRAAHDLQSPPRYCIFLLASTRSGQSSVVVALCVADTKNTMARLCPA